MSNVRDVTNIMRPLSQEEAVLFKQQQQRNSIHTSLVTIPYDKFMGMEVAYTVSEDLKWTTAVISYDGAIYVGTAKRMTYAEREDGYSFDTGSNIAFCRAIKTMPVYFADVAREYERRTSSQRQQSRAVTFGL